MATINSTEHVIPACTTCQKPLKFMGIATTERMGSFGRLRCDAGHEQWKQNHVDEHESGWRLTLPLSRLDGNDQLARFLPAFDRTVGELYALFENLPSPHTYRPGQQGMGYSVALALRDNMTLLANAGVGIGKTFAYLLPALTWLRERKFDTIVIATRTILLQHQLMNDIKTAQRILGTQIPVLLVKGQPQYLCMERIQNTPASLTPELRKWRDSWGGKYEAAIVAEEERLKSITHTKYQGRIDADGGYLKVRAYSDADAHKLAKRYTSLPPFTAEQIDRAAFPQVPDSLWSEIQVTPETNCNTCDIRQACGWYKLREQRTQFRGLMVVNHGLLARDAHNRHSDNQNGLWPLPKAVIVDEAHALEDSLRQSGAMPVKPSDVRRIFGRVVKHLNSSHLVRSRQTANRLSSVAKALATELQNSIRKSDAEVRKVDSAFEIKAQTLSPTARLKDTLNECIDLRNAVEDALTLLLRDQDEQGLGSLFRALEGLRRWVAERDQSPYVVWIDEKRVIQVGVLDLSGPMEAITRQAAILASGTLGIKNDFTLLEIGLGLSIPTRDRILRLYAPSPFDYPHQLTYQLVTNLPNPRDDQSCFQYRASEVARALLTIHQEHARVLALFTSKRLMNAVEGALRGKTLVIHDGQGSADELARHFRETNCLIYLSTAAWEGLDAPGPKAVVIVQLPYPVPSDPWLKAKSRNAQVKRRDEMARIIIPVMQLRMIQGTGRAIRRHDDSGMVIVLDPRAHERFRDYLAPVLPNAPANPITL